MLSVLPDAVVTNVDTPVTINVLANDSGTNLTITSFSKPAHGGLDFNGDRTFTYMPAAGVNGGDKSGHGAEQNQASGRAPWRTRWLDS